MRRRKFLCLVGGAAAAWPTVVRAQQTQRVRRVGVLMAHAESDPEFQVYVAAFRGDLRNSGGRKAAILKSIFAGGHSMMRKFGNDPRKN
jgi:putative ABC transport system substrate-binding protein